MRVGAITCGARSTCEGEISGDWVVVDCDSRTTVSYEGRSGAATVGSVGSLISAWATGTSAMHRPAAEVRSDARKEREYRILFIRRSP